jgi:hypothetical protein
VRRTVLIGVMLVAIAAGLAICSIFGTPGRTGILVEQIQHPAPRSWGCLGGYAACP